MFRNPNNSGTVISSSSPAVALEHGWCSFPKVAKVPNLTRCLEEFQLIQKFWKRFKFQQPFGKIINRWNRKFHYHFKIIVGESAEAFWTQAGGILYMDRAAKVKVPGAARSFFYHLNSHLRFSKRSMVWFWPHWNVSQLKKLFPGLIVRKVSCQMCVKVSLAWCRTLSSYHSFNWSTIINVRCVTNLHLACRLKKWLASNCQKKKLVISLTFMRCKVYRDIKLPFKLCLIDLAVGWVTNTGMSSDLRFCQWDLIHLLLRPCQKNLDVYAWCRSKSIRKKRYKKFREVLSFCSKCGETMQVKIHSNVYPFSRWDIDQDFSKSHLVYNDVELLPRAHSTALPPNKVWYWVYWNESRNEN